MTMSIGIVGEGERFLALVHLLDRTETEIRLWSPGDVVEKDLPGGLDPVPLHEMSDVPLIFLAVPFAELRETATELGDVITGRHSIVHLCHGFEFATLATASEILEEETPTHRFGFLTGPMRREDVESGSPASGVCATHFPEIQKIAQKALVSQTFRLYRGSDILGAEVAAAYGRVIAMAAGVAGQMNLGQSIQATLFARGLAEMARVVLWKGGTERTTFGLSGSANLFIDVVGPGSTDYQIGAAAMQKQRFDADAVREEYGRAGRELVALVESLSVGLDGSGLDTHILEACNMMVSGDGSPAEVVTHLMSLPTLRDE